MAKYVDISHDDEKCQQSEYHVVFHCHGVCRAVVAVLGFAEDERFIGEAESLGYHHHYHGYLDTCAVDAELRACLMRRTVVQVREYNLGYALIELSGQSHHEYRPCIA